MYKPESTGTGQSASTAEARMKGPARLKAKDVFYKVGTSIHRVISTSRRGGSLAKPSGCPSSNSSPSDASRARNARQRPLGAGGLVRRRRPAPGVVPQPPVNPEVRATFAGSTRTMIARIATEEERAELWPRITSVFEGYADATHLKSPPSN